MMSGAGKILIAIGFLAGAYASVTSAETVSWGLYALGIALGVLGVALAAASRRLREADRTAAEADFGVLTTSMARIVTNVDELVARGDTLSVYDLPDELDRRLVEPLGAFASSREAIARHRGIQEYANLMSHFAAGERYVNRAWCSAADGYVDEAQASLERAREEFHEVSRRLADGA